MDEKLEQHWKNELPPFAGELVRPTDYLPLAELRACLLSMIARLKEAFSNEVLFTLHDWHAHDGFGVHAKMADWSLVESWLKSDEALYGARTGDFAVRVGLYSESLAWYLRFYVEDEDGDEIYPGRWGDFDLVGTSELLASISFPKTKAPIERISAKAFFDETYAG